MDKRYKRTDKTSLELFSTEPPVHMCVNTSVTLSVLNIYAFNAMSFIMVLLISYFSLIKCTLQDNIQDFIEPIVIYATHDFTYNDSPEFCKICPVESKSSKSKSTQTLLLAFDIGCGEDRVCNSNISATVKFREVK